MKSYTRVAQAVEVIDNWYKTVNQKCNSKTIRVHRMSDQIFFWWSNERAISIFSLTASEWVKGPFSQLYKVVKDERCHTSQKPISEAESFDEITGLSFMWLINWSLSVKLACSLLSTYCFLIGCFVCVLGFQVFCNYCTSSCHWLTDS